MNQRKWNSSLSTVQLTVSHAWEVAWYSAMKRCINAYIYTIMIIMIIIIIITSSSSISKSKSNYLRIKTRQNMVDLARLRQKGKMCIDYLKLPTKLKLEWVCWVYLLVCKCREAAKSVFRKKIHQMVLKIQAQICWYPKQLTLCFFLIWFLIWFLVLSCIFELQLVYRKAMMQSFTLTYYSGVICLFVCLNRVCMFSLCLCGFPAGKTPEMVFCSIKWSLANIWRSVLQLFFSEWGCHAAAELYAKLLCWMQSNVRYCTVSPFHYFQMQ